MVRSTYSTILIIALFVSVGQTEAQEKQPPRIEQSTLGNTKNVHKADNLIFAGQFTKEEIKLIQDAKVTRVITLRTDGEIDWDEEAAIKAAGMKFIKLPFRKPETLTDELFDEVRNLLRDKSETTLFHCGSANRVGGAWLPFRVLDEGVDLEQALKEAKEIGLKTPFIKEKALDYIRRNQQPPKLAGETSVKPGINNSFKDPNLDVDKMLKRFELESREVYLNRNKIIEACDVKPGNTVADIGAGTGLFSRLFSGAVGDEGWVYAVDIAPRLVGHITQQATAKNLTNITGVVCAENSVNLPTNSVDFVFICDTYHHFEYPKSTLASIHKALRSGGRMVVVDFDRIEGKSREWLLGHVRAGKEVFRAEIQDAGFRLIEEKKMEGLEENYFLVFQK